MPRGGARPNTGGKKPGAGRPKNSIGKRTKMLRAIADKALESGCTPLEVMLDNMRFYRERSEALLTRIEDCIAVEDGLEAAIALAKFGEARLHSQDCAEASAPYVHAKLSSVSVSGRVDGTVNHVLGTMTAQEAAAAYATTIKANKS